MSCERDFAAHFGAFCRDGFLIYLNQNELTAFQHVADFAGLVGDALEFEIGKIAHGGVAVHCAVHEFGLCGKLRSEVEVMKERVFFASEVDERGVKSRHYLVYSAEEHVPNRILVVLLFGMVFDKPLVLQQGNLHFTVCRFYYQFFLHVVQKC